MSGNKVLGKNVIIELLVSGTYYPVFCGKNMEFVQQQELVEVTSINSAVAREYESGMTTASLSISGVTILDNTDSRIAITYLMQESIRRVAQTLRIRMIDDTGATIQIGFNALITSNTLSRTFGAYSQSSTALTVTGGISITPVTPPPPATVNVLSDYWIPTNGNNYLDGTSVVNSYNLGATDTILGVAVEGTEFDLIASGTVGNRQCKFNTSTFIILFASDQIFDGTQRVFVLFKRT